MKKLSLLLLLMLCFGLTACSSSDSQSKEALDSMDKITLSEEDITTRVSIIPTVLDIETTTPEVMFGETDNFDGCNILMYFSSSLVDQSTFTEEGTAEKGTACGGSIEIYETEDNAKARDEYLDKPLLSTISPGTHAVHKNIIVRISKKMTDKQQKEFEEILFTVLTTNDAKELLDVAGFKFSDFEESDHSTNHQPEDVAAENKSETSVSVDSEGANLAEDEAALPEASIIFSGSEYTDVVSKLEAAGFTNISTEILYDLDTGFWASMDLNNVETVSVDGITEFDKGAIFKKDAPIVVTYHAFEHSNPSISYTRYTVSELLSDLESNPMRAEKEHSNEYVELTGKVRVIDDDGKYILLHDSKHAFELDMIYCDVLTEDIKEHLLSLSTGDTITLQGKITIVDIMYPYSVDIFKFS